MTKKNIGVLFVCCCMVASTIGILTNSAGVFFTSVADSFGVGRGSVSLTLTISNMAYAVGGLFTVKWIRNANFKKTVLLFSSIYGISTAVLGICPDVFFMYVLSVIRGFSTGVIGMVLVTILINNHFISNVGLATSIALGFSGIAGAILSPVFTFLIQSTGWRMSYVCIGILSFVLYLPCILSPVGLGNKEVETVNGNNAVVHGGNISKAIFFMVCVYIFACSAGTAIPQHFPGMIENGAILVSVTMIANTAGKVLFGILADKVGTRKSLLLYGCIVCAGLISLLVSKERMIWIIASAMVGFVYAMSAVGGVLFSREVFRESYDVYYPKVALIGTVSNAVFTTLIGYMYDLFQSYNEAIIMLAVLIAGSMVTVLMCKR